MSSKDVRQIRVRANRLKPPYYYGDPPPEFIARSNEIIMDSWGALSIAGRDRMCDLFRAAGVESGLSKDAITGQRWWVLNECQRLGIVPGDDWQRRDVETMRAAEMHEETEGEEEGGTRAGAQFLQELVSYPRRIAHERKLASDADRLMQQLDARIEAAEKQIARWREQRHLAEFERRQHLERADIWQSEYDDVLEMLENVREGRAVTPLSAPPDETEGD